MGKLVVDFILVIIELGNSAEALRADVDCKSAFSLKQGQFGLKFQLAASYQQFVLKEIKMNDLSFGVKMCHCHVWA